MNDLLLTIGIPTFNGAKALQKNLIKLFELLEAEALVDEVEILVSNNASADTTASVCRSFESRKNFSYYENAQNIGYDRNVNEVVEKARGAYVWLLSDDDTIDHGVRFVLDLLKKFEPSYLFVNFPNEIGVASTEKFQVYGDINEFFSANKFKSGLISSNIVQKSLWLKLNMPSYFGCQWIHFAYAIHALAPEYIHNAILIFEQLVHQEENPEHEQRWGNGGLFLLTGLCLLEVFDKLPSLGANKKTVYLSKRIISGAYPKNIYIARTCGLNIDKDIINRFGRLFADQRIHWIFVIYPALIMPLIFYKIGIRITGLGHRISAGLARRFKKILKR